MPRFKVPPEHQASSRQAKPYQLRLRSRKGEPLSLQDGAQEPLLDEVVDDEEVRPTNTGRPVSLRSPSPPPRLPSDFHPVTSESFMQSVWTPFEGVHYLNSFIPTPLATEWYEKLLALPQWYRPTLKLYGREIVQSRSIAAFSKVQDLKLKYSGQEVQMESWPPVLQDMERKVRDYIGHDVRFNHAMLNLYENGSVNIGKHSDNLENRVIVTVSLGADRTWRMTKKPPRGAKAQAKRDRTKIDAPEIHRWTLKNGSLLVMQGNCQQEWYHEIPKEQKVKQGRISITFRQLVYE